MDLPGPLWLVGCGNMAGAMLGGWIAAGIERSQITVIRPSGQPVAEGVRVLTRPPEGPVPATVMLGMKPYQIDEVAAWLEPILDEHVILISILAGVEQASHRARFPRLRTIVRAMPNTPVRIGKGVIALHSDSPDGAARGQVEQLMAPLGHVEWFADEALFKVTTSLTGSGPAFLYRFIDALAQAGVGQGMEADQALRLATATVEGAASLAAAGEEPPHILADRVASPGGSTRQGLNVLDEDRGIRDLMARTLAASIRRSEEMAEEARRQR